jgi:hypothetical protein
MLFVIQSGGLTGCAAGNDGISTVFYLKINQFAQFFFINRSVAEWCDDCYNASLNMFNYLRI